jgi:multiple sugar transport system permease protein
MTLAPTIDAAPANRTRRSTRGTARAVPTILLLALLVYIVLPLFWLVVSATKSNADLLSSFGLWFSSDMNLFANIRDLFTYDDGVFARWLANTAYYSVLSAVGAALIATAGGYAFAKYRFRGRNGLFAIILGSIMVPSTALVIPTYLLLSKAQLTDTPLAVILPSLLSPFGLYLMRIYAEQSVPDDLVDAARVDGAGEFQIFRRVAFRILAPGFVTVLLFQFVATWNNYFLPLVVLSDPSHYPVTVGLASWNAQASAGGGAHALFSLVITGALVATAPIVLAFLLLQRYWRSGLTLGSLR